MDAPTLLQSGVQWLDGPSGVMEVVFDVPRHDTVGMILIGHPQPLLGGSALHKVPAFFARALCDAGWLVARPNFRGVGDSAGVHDQGVGETDDVLALHEAMRMARPELPMALLGCSFGAFVMARVAHLLARAGQPALRVCLAGMPFGEVEGGRRYDTPDGFPNALVVHGERDDRVPLVSVFDWARPSLQPVVVVPGADHLFTGKLHVLRALMLLHLNLNQ